MDVLVPLDSLHAEYQAKNALTREADRLARYYRVSTRVMLRRIFDLGDLSRAALLEAYCNELQRIDSEPKHRGCIHPVLLARVGRRFGSALVFSTLAGENSFTETFRLLDVKRVSTLREFGAVLERL